jgi:iron complex outermembrane receptor protein
METTPKLGLNYNLSPNYLNDTIDSMLLYASAAKGFKSGGYNGIIITSLNDAQTPYGPESNWTYEFGLKTDLLDHRLRINAAYFYQKGTNIAANATTLVDGVLTSPVRNVGDATIQGLELEMSAVPMDGLTVFYRPTLLKGKYTRLIPGAAPALALERYGVNPTPGRLPSLAYSAGFDYQRDIQLGNYSGRFLSGMTYWRTTAHPTGGSNQRYEDAYDKMNGYIGVEFKDVWQLKLASQNLQDNITISSSSGLGGYIARPRRQVMLTLSYQM